MLLKLYQAGQPILRKSAKRLSKQELLAKHTQDVIDFMIATLRDAPGVGLAAPQVGEALQIILVEDKKSYHETVPSAVLKEQGRKPVALKVLINPTLEILDPTTALYFEGCLSVDGYAGAVPRARRVKLSALDRTGKVVSYIAEGWQARILQHEVDHLYGTLYIDHMLDESFMSSKNFSMLWRKALELEIKKGFNTSL